ASDLDAPSPPTLVSDQPPIRMAEQPSGSVQVRRAADSQPQARGVRPSGAPALPAPAPGVIQRCGGVPCDCPSQRHADDELMTAKAPPSRVPAVRPTTAVPPIVGDVVRSPGAPPH